MSSISPELSSRLPSSPSASQPNLARVRDNQRRSRARRKEYIQELEAKLRRCDALGVQASVDIQVAARAVSAENSRLREENSRLKDENERLRTTLREREERQIVTVDADKDHENLAEEGGSILTTAAMEYGKLGVEPLQPIHSLTERCNGDISSKTRAPVSMSTQSSSLHSSPAAIQHSTDYGSGIDPSLRDSTATYAQHFPSEPETTSHEVTSSPGRDIMCDDTSSCEYAAHIITSMRADVSSDDVRVDLGCRYGIEEWKKCKVNNAKLFVAMDRYAV